MEWRKSPSFPDYEVSEMGDVRRIKTARTALVTGKYLKSANCNGYRNLGLRRDGRSFSVKVHKLVAEAFLGPRPFDSAAICHNDGIKSHNDYRNLRWDTYKANMADNIAHGTDGRGIKHWNAKLNESDVVDIRRRIAVGENKRAIAASYQVKCTTIWRIHYGKSWSHVP